MRRRIQSFLTLARRIGRPRSRGRLDRMADRDTVQLHLLRHAHAGDPESWSGRRREAALGKGEGQAERRDGSSPTSASSPNLHHLAEIGPRRRRDVARPSTASPRR